MEAARLQERVQDLKGCKEITQLTMGLLLLHVDARHRTARKSWETLRETLEAPGDLFPVLLNDNGEILCPTGLIQARFHESLSDKELESFAKEHNLRLVERNRFQPAQASFEMQDPATTYLPEVVDEVNKPSTVRVAWAETMAHYRRS
jgi:hypothetical protein